MLHALEQIRRMRGGAQAHLMRCSDGNYYVVKFQNNPQHRRVLVNELLGTRLASRLKLPTAPVEVIYVSPELIRLTPDLCIELPRSRTPCVPGPQFGSRYPGDPRELTLHDFLPDEKLREVTNIGDFAGMLVFDKWTCNTNGRQTLFFEENKRRTGESLGNLPPPSPGSGQPTTLPYKTVLIVQRTGRATMIETIQATEPGWTCAYRVLRYTPNLVRDEWVNIGVLVFDPQTGERRLRMIEEPEEYARVRRLHPRADEELLRWLRDDLENRFATATQLFSGNGQDEGNARTDWLKLLGKWDDTLSHALQLAPQKGVEGARDLDFETDRLYADHVAPQRGATRVGAGGTRSAVRSYCAQVLRQARLWERMEKGVHAAEFTFPGDPMRLDYGYRRNGTRGFVQALSVSRAPADAKLLAYTAGHIREKVNSAEFTAVTDVHLMAENERHRFVQETLRDAGVDAVPMEAFAVWTAKMRPLIQ